jgi:antitoxin component YwqK of YwqJK toxin-antitoxin module
LQDDKAAKAATLDTVKIRPGTVSNYRENYRSGKPKVEWSAGVGQEGRYLLDGKETWYYENGHKEWEVTYSAGSKAGVETYWNSDG